MVKAWNNLCLEFYRCLCVRACVNGWISLQLCLYGVQCSVLPTSVHSFIRVVFYHSCFDIFFRLFYLYPSSLLLFLFIISLELDFILNSLEIMWERKIRSGQSLKQSMFGILSMFVRACVRPCVNGRISFQLCPYGFQCSVLPTSVHSFLCVVFLSFMFWYLFAVIFSLSFIFVIILIYYLIGIRFYFEFIRNYVGEESKHWSKLGTKYVLTSIDVCVCVRACVRACVCEWPNKLLIMAIRFSVFCQFLFSAFFVLFFHHSCFDKFFFRIWSLDP